MQSWTWLIVLNALFSYNFFVFCPKTNKMLLNEECKTLMFSPVKVCGTMSIMTKNYYYYFNFWGDG